MTDTARPYVADHELASLLKVAAHREERLRVKTEDATYELQVTKVTAPGDLWGNYDPEEVRAAVRRSLARGSSTDPIELDPMIAEIRSQRDQAPPTDQMP